LNELPGINTIYVMIEGGRIRYDKPVAPWAKLFFRQQEKDRF